MSDFNRLLGDALKKDRDDSSPSPHDIARTRRSVMQQVHRRTNIMFAGVAAAAVAVIAAIFVGPNLVPDRGPQVPAAEESRTPSPAPSAPSPRPTEQESVTGGSCRIRFQPTYVPRGFSYDLEPGSGGGGTGFPAIGHYAGPQQGTFIDVAVGKGRYYRLAPGAEQIGDVVGIDNGARFGPVEGGYAVEFSLVPEKPGGPPCRYALYGFGIEGAELRTFAQMLVPSEEGLLSRYSGGFAVWPEVDPQDAVESCREVLLGADPWRSTARTTAEEFARQELGWDVPAVRVPRGYGEGVFVVSPKGSSRTDAEALVIVQPLVSLPPVVGTCWSVTSVAAGKPHPEVNDLGHYFDGRTFEFAIPRRQAANRSPWSSTSRPNQATARSWSTTPAPRRRHGFS